MPTTISGSTGVTFPAGGVGNTAGAAVGTTDTQTLTTKTLGSGLVADASLITSGTAVATTSGTSVDFTGLPSWVKRITLLLNVVSTTGTNNLWVQIGSGSYTTTGYVSTAFYATTGPSTNSVTNGFLIRSDNAGNNTVGAMVLTSFGSNTWVETWTGGNTSNNQVMVGGGLLTLSGVLDRIKLITTGGDSFDAGSINIIYE